MLTYNLAYGVVNVNKKSVWDRIYFEEEDIYDLDEIEHMVDDDMLASWEAGFMQGWDDAG